MSASSAYPRRFPARRGGVLVVSLAAARRDPLKSALTADPWDLIIVDEAHRVRAPRSASGQLIRQLRSRHLLLLTATPVENRLQDLYEMVSLVAPGLLGTAAQFRAAHGTAAADSEPRNVSALRKQTAEVMIRHRRSEVSVLLPQRLAETLRVDPSGEEREWYADLAARVRAEGRAATPARKLTLRSVAKLAGSSPAAAAPTLAKIGWDSLSARAARLTEPAKAAVLRNQLSRFAATGEKVLVFTAFRQTLELLADQVPGAAIYHGSLPRAEKERVIAAFRDEAPVLLCTESAGEGRNLQFCHVMVNMDLPWNPMQIEQRLGRLHRVGQQHDVLLTNLVARGTIEEQMLRVLEAKINLFELVVGELDMILGRVDDEFDFETTVFDAFVVSQDDAEFGERMAVIGDGLARARTDYLASRAATDNLVGYEAAHVSSRPGAGVLAAARRHRRRALGAVRRLGVRRPAVGAVGRVPAAGRAPGHRRSRCRAGRRCHAARRWAPRPCRGRRPRTGRRRRRLPLPRASRRCPAGTRRAAGGGP